MCALHYTPTGPCPVYGNLPQSDFLLITTEEPPSLDNEKASADEEQPEAMWRVEKSIFGPRRKVSVKLHAGCLKTPIHRDELSSVSSIDAGECCCRLLTRMTTLTRRRSWRSVCKKISSDYLSSIGERQPKLGM